MPLSTPTTDFRGKPFLRFLDTAGDGTGTKEAIGDYSGVITDFFIAPAEDESFSLTRLLLQIVDMGNFVASKYGNITALTNGIKILLLENSTIIKDFTDGLPIKTNGELARFCFDTTMSAFGGGAQNYADALCEFDEGGTAIKLPFGSSLVVRLNDDFTGLMSHTFLIAGKEL